MNTPSNRGRVRWVGTRSQTTQALFLSIYLFLMVLGMMMLAIPREHQVNDRSWMGLFVLPVIPAVAISLIFRLYTVDHVDRH